MSTDILLVDPDASNARQIKDPIEDTGQNTVHVVHTGEDALDHLNQRGEYSDAPAAQIVLLNPDLTDIDGYEILQELRNEPELQLLPVIILSESTIAEDVVESYTLHANAHLQIPDDPDKLEEFITAIKSFWLDTVQLPPTSN